MNTSATANTLQSAFNAPTKVLLNFPVGTDMSSIWERLESIGWKKFVVDPDDDEDDDELELAPSEEYDYRSLCGIIPDSGPFTHDRIAELVWEYCEDKRRRNAGEEVL